MVGQFGECVRRGSNFGHRPRGEPAGIGDNQGPGHRRGPFEHKAEENVLGNWPKLLSPLHCFPAHLCEKSKAVPLPALAHCINPTQQGIEVGCFYQWPKFVPHGSVYGKGGGGSVGKSISMLTLPTPGNPIA